MIVGDKILRRNLIKLGKASRLKNGTFDLTIGEIFPVGIEKANSRGMNGAQYQHYSLAPQQMVWVISAESFSMPADVTGLTTLRTTLTHQGLLALNVWIIDSHFSGQISTVIINFSQVARTIEVGMPFFRIIFFDHDPVRPPDRPDLASTESDVIRKAAGEFPSNFLNLPGSNDEYYASQLSKLVLGYVKTNIIKSVIFVLLIGIIVSGSLKEILQFLDLMGLIDADKLKSFIQKP